MLADRRGARGGVKNYLGFFLDSLYRATGGETQQQDFLTRFYELFTEDWFLIPVLAVPRTLALEPFGRFRSVLMGLRDRA